jgi:hypothetical protein
MVKSHRAIHRECNRLGRILGRERRRGARVTRTALTCLGEDRNYIRIEAARQALAWALGDNAMSMSKIDALTEREMRRRKRRERA